MDWIERLLGLSPDGGSGATEITIIVVLAAAAVAIAVGVVGRRGRRV